MGFFVSLFRSLRKERDYLLVLGFRPEPDSYGLKNGAGISRPALPLTLVKWGQCSFWIWGGLSTTKPSPTLDYFHILKQNFISWSLKKKFTENVRYFNAENDEVFGWIFRKFGCFRKTVVENKYYFCRYHDSMVLKLFKDNMNDQGLNPAINKKDFLNDQ